MNRLSKRMFFYFFICFLISIVSTGCFLLPEVLLEGEGVAAAGVAESTTAVAAGSTTTVVAENAAADMATIVSRSPEMLGVFGPVIEGNAAYEDAFFDKLGSVRIETETVGESSPRLYINENGGRKYFAFADNSSSIRTFENETIDLSKRGWKMYRVTGDHVNVKMLPGNNYELYKVKDGSPLLLSKDRVVLVLNPTNPVNSFYEIKLGTDQVGFVSAAFIELIGKNQATPLNGQNPGLSTSNQQLPVMTDYPKGDYCIKNVGQYSMTVHLHSVEDQNLTLQEITINPKEQGCFLDLPAKVYSIECYTNYQPYFGRIIRSVKKQIRVEEGVKNPSPDNIQLLLDGEEFNPPSNGFNDEKKQIQEPPVGTSQITNNGCDPNVGTIYIINKSSVILLFLVSDSYITPGINNEKYDQATIEGNSQDVIPGLKPGYYYICGTYVRKTYNACLYNKKVEVKGCKQSSVIVNISPPAPPMNIQ